MNFIPLQKLIPKTAVKYGIANEFKAIAVCKAFENLLPELFPNISDIEKHVSPRFYKNRILTIHVSGSSWASELMMRKPQILEALNEKFEKEYGRGLLKDIKTSS